MLLLITKNFNDTIIIIRHDFMTTKSTFIREQLVSVQEKKEYLKYNEICKDM